MGPCERRWWRLLDEVPAMLGRVERWLDAGPPPDDGRGGDHLHAVPTLVVCLAGVTRHVRPGGRIDLRPGDALLIAPGIWHRHESTRTGSAFFAQGFLASASDVVLGDHAASVRGHLPREPSRQLIELALAEADPTARRRRCVDLLRQVLAETVSTPDPAPPALRRMLHRMWSGLHRGVGVDDLVAASGLSRAQSYRVFAAGYGVPPKAALELARLELADSLRSRGLGPAAIAARCGFPSRATFARARRRATLRLEVGQRTRRLQPLPRLGADGRVG